MLIECSLAGSRLVEITVKRTQSKAQCSRPVQITLVDFVLFASSLTAAVRQKPSIQGES